MWWPLTSLYCGLSLLIQHFVEWLCNGEDCCTFLLHVMLREMLGHACCSIPNVLAFLSSVEAAEVIQHIAFYVSIRNYCDSVLLALVYYKASFASQYATWHYCHCLFFVVCFFCLWFYSNVHTFFLPQDVDYWLVEISANLFILFLSCLKQISLFLYVNFFGTLW